MMNRKVDHTDEHQQFEYDVITRFIDEPVLNESYKAIKNFAEKQGLEIVTEKDMKVSAMDFSFSFIELGEDTQYLKEESHNQRPLAHIVKEAVPGAPGAQWALDITRDTFIIFEARMR